MSLHFIAVVGFVISVVLCITTIFLLSSFRSLYGTAQRVLRPRAGRTGVRSMTDAGCGG